MKKIQLLGIALSLLCCFTACEKNHYKNIDIATTTVVSDVENIEQTDTEEPVSDTATDGEKQSVTTITTATAHENTALSTDSTGKSGNQTGKENSNSSKTEFTQTTTVVTIKRETTTTKNEADVKHSSTRNANELPIVTEGRAVEKQTSQPQKTTTTTTTRTEAAKKDENAPIELPYIPLS